MKFIIITVYLILVGCTKTITQNEDIVLIEEEYVDPAINFPKIYYHKEDGSNIKDTLFLNTKELEQGFKNSIEFKLVIVLKFEPSQQFSKMKVYTSTNWMNFNENRIGYSMSYTYPNGLQFENPNDSIVININYYMYRPHYLNTISFQNNLITNFKFRYFTTSSSGEVFGRSSCLIFSSLE